MPGKRGFTSKAQQGFMFAKHPEIAKRMAEEAKAAGVDMKKLPKHVGKKKGK
jgi:hypothetical protein